MTALLAGLLARLIAPVWRPRMCCRCRTDRAITHGSLEPVCGGCAAVLGLIDHPTPGGAR